ncbi:MAG: transglycosylase SLT domain-containing protein [Methanotrichaceae archaeon]
MRILGIAIILMIFVIQMSLALGQNAANTAFIEDPFNYHGEYKLDPTKLTADENTALSYVQRYANDYGISPYLLMAMINHESSFNSNSVGDNGLAIGYMQLHWDAAYDAGYRSPRGGTKELAEEDWPTDGLDPDVNLRYGCEYLEICYRKCSNSGVYAGDTLKNTISSYNQGWPHGPDRINEDTYVNPIIANYEIYKNKIMYYVDLGNPNDEATHNLVGWGDLQGPPDNPYVSPSGDKTKRYQILHGDNSVDFSLKRIDIPYLLTFEVEDGNCDDSFEVWIGNNNLGFYKGHHSQNEAKSYEVVIPKEYITSTDTTITFRNRASDNCGLAAVYNVKLVPQPPA